MATAEQLIDELCEATKPSVKKGDKIEVLSNKKHKPGEKKKYKVIEVYKDYVVVGIGKGEDAGATWNGTNWTLNKSVF